MNLDIQALRGPNRDSMLLDLILANPEPALDCRTREELIEAYGQAHADALLIDGETAVCSATWPVPAFGLAPKSTFRVLVQDGPVVHVARVTPLLTEDGATFVRLGDSVFRLEHASILSTERVDGDGNPPLPWVWMPGDPAPSPVPTLRSLASEHLRKAS